MEEVAGSDSLAGKGKEQGCYPVLAIFASLHTACECELLTMIL